MDDATIRARVVSLLREVHPDDRRAALSFAAAVACERYESMDLAFAWLAFMDGDFDLVEGVVIRGAVVPPDIDLMAPTDDPPDDEDGIGSDLTAPRRRWNQ